MIQHDSLHMTGICRSLMPMGWPDEPPQPPPQTVHCPSMVDIDRILSLNICILQVLSSLGIRPQRRFDPLRTLQDVTEVVDTCHEAGISKRCVKLRPIAVIKG